MNFILSVTHIRTIHFVMAVNRKVFDDFNTLS